PLRSHAPATPSYCCASAPTMRPRRPSTPPARSPHSSASPLPLTYISLSQHPSSGRESLPYVGRVIGSSRRIGDGQTKVEDRAMRRIPRRPQPAAVRFDDRTADRQPHAHAARLGGEKRIEQPVDVAG